MKIAVISDLHLTSKFNNKLFLRLEEVIQSNDKVIINGDFWDSYTSSFDKFVKSDWSKLFPLFLEKEAIYIYGNHDPKELSDKRVSLFSVQQGVQHEFKFGSKIIHLEHGNLIIPSWTEKLPLMKRNKIVFRFIAYLHNLFARLEEQVRSFESIHKSREEELKNKVLEKRQANEIWIAAHSHLSSVDLKNGYANSGMFESSYIQIDTNAETVELIN